MQVGEGEMEEEHGVESDDDGCREACFDDGARDSVDELVGVGVACSSGEEVPEHGAGDDGVAENGAAEPDSGDGLEFRKVRAVRYEDGH